MILENRDIDTLHQILAVDMHYTSNQLITKPFALITIFIISVSSGLAFQKVWEWEMCHYIIWSYHSHSWRVYIFCEMHSWSHTELYMHCIITLMEYLRKVCQKNKDMLRKIFSIINGVVTSQCNVFLHITTDI